MLADLMGGNDIQVIPDETAELEKIPKIKLFDYIKAISESNNRIIVDSGYSEFMVNKIFSEFIDCILSVGIANRSKFLDKQSHFDFLQKSISTKTKRYNKKQENLLSDLEELIISLCCSKKWKCSHREAIINCSFLNRVEKLEIIKPFIGLLDEDFIELNKTSYFSLYTKSQISIVIEGLKNAR